METKLLGLDPASFKNLGWAVISVSQSVVNGSTFKNGTIILHDQITGNTSWRAMWPIFLAVDHLLSTVKPDMVIIEKTSSFKGGFVTGQVSNCIGVILACCGKHDVNVEFVYPSHVKKVIAGAGRATKKQMKIGVNNALRKAQIDKDKIKFDSEHACDATANILCWIQENCNGNTENSMLQDKT